MSERRPAPVPGHVGRAGSVSARLLFTHRYRDEPTDDDTEAESEKQTQLKGQFTQKCKLGHRFLPPDDVKSGVNS